MTTTATSVLKTLQSFSLRNILNANIYQWMEDTAIFATEYFKDFRTLGTPLACSPYVAKELLSYVLPADAHEAPRNFLEVGAGTGAMTKYLIRKLRPNDQLHLVEINEKLCDRLQEKYGAISNVFIHHVPVQEWTPPENARQFDIIITTVPLNSLPSPEVLESILSTFKKLAKPGGYVSFVEYALTTTLGRAVSFGRAGEKYNKMIAHKNRFFDAYSFKRALIFANIPVARVTHCRHPTTSAR